MSEMYWITRLAGLNTFFTVVAVLSGFLVIISFMEFAMEQDDAGEEKLASIIRCANLSVVVFVLATLIACMIPDKRDLLLIYGVGKAIDYTKEHKELRELPANASKAINKWLNEDAKKQDNE